MESLLYPSVQSGTSRCRYVHQQGKSLMVALDDVGNLPLRIKSFEARFSMVVRYQSFSQFKDIP